VRVRILACGVGASELHAEETLEFYPVPMGHEPVGIVESVGEGVDDLTEGMRVTGGFGPSFAEHVIAQRRQMSLLCSIGGPKSQNSRTELDTPPMKISHLATNVASPTEGQAKRTEIHDSPRRTPSRPEKSCPPHARNAQRCCPC
jgi:hypothetical protein